MADIKHRLTALEIQAAQQSSAEANHYASLAMRLDRLDGRVERIERRADLVDAG